MHRAQRCYRILLFDMRMKSVVHPAERRRLERTKKVDGLLDSIQQMRLEPIQRLQRAFDVRSSGGRGDSAVHLGRAPPFALSWRQAAESTEYLVQRTDEQVGRQRVNALDHVHQI